MKPSTKFTHRLKAEPGLFSRVLLVLLVIALVAFTMWISGPVPSDEELAGIPAITQTSSLSVTGQATVEPEPIIEQTPTSGVLAGTIAIVVIIFVGTLVTIWQMRDRSALKKK
jgi:hypothetical protein